MSERSHSTKARLAGAHLARPLLRREQSRRRAVLLGIATLILLGTSPVFGHHLASQAEVLLAGRDHVFNVCLIALHALLAPVHGVFHILLILGLVFATSSRVRASIRARRTLSALPSSALHRVDAAFRHATERAGVSQSAVRVVEGLPVPAFTAGLLRPRIFVAANLVDILNDEELTMVIAHEGAHAARRDPLRLWWLRFLGDTLFYIPALRRLAGDMADEAEVAADDSAAVTISGGATMLASAIVKLASWKNGRAPGELLTVDVVGFYRADLVERRVRRLLGEDAPVGTHVTARSLSGAIAMLGLAMLSGLIMAHPLAAGTVAPSAQELESPGSKAPPGHCYHRDGMAISHLFCLGFFRHVDSAHCPHTGM